jgi:hypothetical protein
MALSLRLPRRDPNKPRTTMRERLRCAAARIMPRTTAGHRKGGGVVLHVDPVYAAIEEAHSAWAAYVTACEAHGQIPFSESETSPTAAAQSEAAATFFSAWERVKAVRPTTLQGTAAYAAYLVEACEKLEEDEFAPSALIAIAEGVQSLTQASRRGGALRDKAKALTAKILHFPKKATVHGDAALIKVWPKFQEAMAENAALNMQIEPCSEAAIASLPEQMPRAEFLKLTEEEQEAQRRYRNDILLQAWKCHGVTALLEEQGRLWDEVIHPLEALIRNTTPTTLQGAAIKAAYLLEYSHVRTLEAEDTTDLDYGEEGLRLFIEQLAGITLGAAISPIRH